MQRQGQWKFLNQIRVSQLFARRELDDLTTDLGLRETNQLLEHTLFGIETSNGIYTLFSPRRVTSLL